MYICQISARPPQQVLAGEGPGAGAMSVGWRADTTGERSSAVCESRHSRTAGGGAKQSVFGN